LGLARAREVFESARYRIDRAARLLA